MKCSVCGTELKPGDKFCMACGTSVAAMTEANVVSQPQEPVPQAPAPAPQEPVVQEAAPQETAPQAPFMQEQPVQPMFIQGDPNGQQVQTMYIPLDANGQPIGGPVQTMYVPVDANGQPIQPIYAQPIPQPMQQPAYAQPMYAQPGYPQPQVFVAPAAAEASGKPVLILGIVSLVLALSGILSAGGIICGAIAISKATGLEKQFGALTNQAKTGKGLGKAGFITGIVVTAFAVLFLGLVFVAYLIDEVL